MSGKSLSRILNNAFQIAGNVTGFKYKQYRPDTYVTPLQTRNYIGDLVVGASPDESFAKNPDELQKYNLYADSSKLQLGDILYSDDNARTFVVVDMMELRVSQGVLCPDRFDVLRPVITSGDKKTGFEQVATQVPGAVKLMGAKSSSGSVQGLQSTLTASSHELEMWTWVPENLVQLNDVIQIGANRYLCTFAQTIARGTHIKMRSTKVGK